MPLISTRNRITNFLFSPHPSVTGIVDSRKARLGIVLAFVMTCTNGISLIFVARSGVNVTLAIQITVTLFAFLSYLLGRTPRFSWGGGLLVAVLSLSGFANVLSGSDRPTDALYVTIPVALVIGSVLLPARGNIVQFIANLIGIALLPLAATFFTYEMVGLAYSVIMSVGALLIVAQIFRDNVEQTRVEEVLAINDELVELQTRLEQRVADRTKDLATVTEVSRRLSVALSPRQLAVDVVEQLQGAFHYYHAHIYFVDEATGDLVMAGGTGEAGAAMLARGHKVPKGRGLVGRAAETNAPILVPDVSKEEGWLPNPLLPETRSEAAIPIASGNDVLGVLDVQQNVVNGLSQDDVTVLQSLADQVSITLKNVRSYEESRSQAELEALVNLIGQKIQRAATIEETLQVAVRELGNSLGAPRVRGNIERSMSGN